MQCSKFLFDAILLRSKTASSAMCLFFEFFICLRFSDVVFYYKCCYVVW